MTAYRRFAERFPERAVVADSRSQVESAVRWICDHANADGDGLFEYVRRSPANLLNQVWKDSFDAVTHVGFDVPAQPVAWIDAQGIAFRALVDAAALHASWGDDDRAATLGRRAEALREKIDDAFWLEPDGCYAMALDGLKEPIRMIGSNPGHLLWAGAAHEERVPRLVSRLRQQDLWTPYGLRTLSSESPLYAPYAYHGGAIWPFDNAVVVLGLLAVGHADAARDLMTRVARAVLTIGSPVELYAALDGELFVVPRMSQPALTVRSVSAVGPDGPVPETGTKAGRPLPWCCSELRCWRQPPRRRRMAERCSGHRVALVHWAVPPTTGGVESHVSDLASALAARGSEVVVLTGEPKPVPIRGAELVTSPLLDLSTIRSKGLAGPLYRRRLEQFLRHAIEDHGIDVVHGHNLHHFTPEPALAIDGLRQRLNLRVHHTFHETWLDVLHERPVYQHWDGTYATSRFVQDECSTHIGFRPELIPLGVDTGRFEARRPPLASSGPPMILHPARLLSWKGVHVSVEMLHELRRRHGREARLVITDTQRIVDWNLELVDYRRRIRDRVSELGLADWVEYRSVDYADMPALLGSADIAGGDEL